MGASGNPGTIQYEQPHRDGQPIITLNRTDKLDHDISGWITHAQGSYHKFDGQAEPLTISPDQNVSNTYSSPFSN